MKTKTFLTIFSFVVTLTLSLSFATISENYSLFRETDVQTREKIYQFLMSDKVLSQKMAEDGVGVGLIRSFKVWRKYQEKKLQLDTSELPEDFRIAWEKKILSEIDNIDFGLYLIDYHGEFGVQTDSQREIGNAKYAENQRLDAEFKSTVESYGIQIGENGELFKK